MNPTVLIVDGHAANARLLQVLLSLDDVVGLIAHDGNEALVLASTHRLDAVALELRLPDMHGSELLRRLRRSAGIGTLPLLVFHAADSEDELQRARTAGADALIEKPFAGKQVRSTIVQLLGMPSTRQQPALLARASSRAQGGPRGHSATTR